MPDPHQLDVAILGAGITGLPAAWKLKEAGRAVRVFEKNRRIGGPIESYRSHGFLFEKGPNTIQVDGQDLLDTFNGLGIGDQLIESNPIANKRYILRDGSPVALPMSPKSLLTTPAFSWKAKGRILAEPFIPGGDASDESLAETVRRRFGQEIVDYAVNSFIAGIYAGSPEEISTRYGFPKIYELEQRHGSLIKGMLRSQKAKRDSEDTFKTRLISFRDGLETLPKAIERQLPNEIELGAHLSQIEHRSGSWSLKTQSGEYSAKHLLVCLPSSGISALPWPKEIATELTPLKTISHPPVTALNLGFARDQISHPLDGFGLLVPEVEPASILGVMFNSTLFPGRAENGQVALTVFVGGSRQPELTQLTDSELESMVISDLQRFLGLSGSPMFNRRVDWPRAIPQYDRNFGTILDTFQSIETSHPGIHFCGHVRDGIALPKCIRAGLNAASRFQLL
ncbi:MAG: protoporphyrinogen oxidase [Opitutales bacterium]|nr:protoporphyrinogen oxidase [Opitutales bacterium]